MAFRQPLERQFGTPVSLYFPQITDRHVDGCAQVNCRLSVGIGPPFGQTKNFSAQSSILRIICRMPAVRLVNR